MVKFLVPQWLHLSQVTSLDSIHVPTDYEHYHGSSIRGPMGHAEVRYYDMLL